MLLGVFAFFALFFSAALLDLVPEADGDTLRLLFWGSFRMWVLCAGGMKGRGV